LTPPTSPQNSAGGKSATRIASCARGDVTT